MIRSKCENCRWWCAVEEDPPSPEGWCRRHAPVPMIIPELTAEGVGSHEAIWPFTMRYNWCGEYEPLCDPRNNVIPRDRLCVRLRKRLPEGLTTLGELLLFGRHSILETRNIGMEAISDLDEVMKENGLFNDWLLT